MNRHQRETLDGTGMRATLTLGSQSHVGMKRSANQDAFCALVGGNAPQGTDALLAVADGMGGHQAGEVASDLAIRGLVSKLGQTSAAAPTAHGTARALYRVFDEINSEIRNEATRPETRGMGTTLTAVALVGGTAAIGHVGDSRAYLLRAGELWQITQDHSWVAEEVARGRLTSREAAEHPRRNVLTRAMGTDNRVEPFTATVPVAVGDVVFLCSDGLHGLVEDAEIAQLLQSRAPDSASNTLVDLANARGGNDNITVVVARVESLNPGGGAAHRMTTLPGIRGNKRNRLRTILKIISAPLWFPFWCVFRLVRAPFHKRK